MTAVPVRHTKFASWFDPDAWMEEMKGARWEALLDEEEAIVKNYTESPAVKKRIGIYKTLYASATQNYQDDTEFETAKGRVKLRWHSDFFKAWWFKQSPSHKHTVRDLVADTNGAVYCTRDFTEGAEQFALECWRPGAKTPTWSHKVVGPDVGLLENSLFYLSVKNKLVYHELWMCDLQGKNHKKIYTVKNIENNLSIERYPDGQLLLIEDHSQEKTYFEIKYDGTLEQLANVRVPPKDWILPILRDYAVIFLWKSQGLMITQTHGEKTLWKCSSSQKPIQLLRIPAGVIKIDPFAAWENRSIFQMIVSHPSEGTIPYIYHPESGPILQYPKVPTTLVGRRIQSFSFDNVTVHGYVAHSRYEAPRKLLVIGYGAYGLPTGVGSFKQRWAPLLENGWAVAVAFVRGGGDHTDAWGYAGRRGDRENTFQDFLAIIRKCQYMFKIAPKHTAIYGRSAGGLLMGGALGKHPDGGLMGAIYTEVPYVDVLRTTTNDELPLTVLEYDEFGNPRMRLEDFLDVGLMSPADSATLLKTPNVFVLARTAVHDSQVFAYEPLKWIRRLREHAPKGAPKLCVVNRHAGHFTAPDIQYDQWSLDCAMLDAWVSGEYDDLP